MHMMLSATFKIIYSIAAVTMLTTRASVTGFSASKSSSPIPPPPPISVPVWSFASASSQTKATSMNIMTFCIPVSVSSPKLWALSFYHGTLTKDSFLGCTEDGHQNTADKNKFEKGSSVGVLQLLKFDHCHLVPILGKKSGRDVDKSALCREEGFPWARISAQGSGDADADEDEDEDVGKPSHINTQDSDFELLPGCALYIQVECKSSAQLIDAGDHVVAICEVTRIGVWEQNDNDEGPNGGKVRWSDEGIDENSIPLALGAIDESKALYSGRLREEGIL